MTGMTTPRLDLDLLPGSFAICHLPPETPLPDALLEPPAAEMVSVTRTGDELSIVCREERVPAGARRVGGWRCLRVRGALPLSLVGVLAALTAPLAAAGVSVFAVSTFDTDYLLVPEADLERARAALAALAPLPPLPPLPVTPPPPPARTPP
jgi:hypothetical protein